MARTLRYLRSVRAAIVLIAALSSVLSALPQADCCLPAAATAMSDAELHEGHGSHGAADADAPADRECSHENHGVSCEQHCAMQVVVGRSVLRQLEPAPVVAVGRLVAQPAGVTITADPPPPRA